MNDFSSVVSFKDVTKSLVFSKTCETVFSFNQQNNVAVKLLG